MRRVLLVLLLGGCHGASAPPRHGDTPGDRLEEAALAAGMVADPANADPVGLYQRDTDRVCVVRAGDGYRLGAIVRYDENQACAAAGEATRSGDRLRVTFGDCRFEARFEGDRIVFPATLPAACAHHCAGRASLDALAAERMSDSAGEAAALVDGSGHPLCAPN